MGTNEDELSIRRTEMSDDAELDDLFNRAHAHLAGTVVRSASDIAWRCRRQPGMPTTGASLSRTQTEEQLDTRSSRQMVM